MNEILCGDSAIVLQGFADNLFDFVLTSPPYGEIRSYKGFSFDFETIARELYRVTKDGGIVCWIVNDQYIDGGRSLASFKQALLFQEIGFKMHDCMIYQKSNFSFPSNNRYHQIYEFMFILSKGKPKTFNPIIDRQNIYVGQKPHGKLRKADGEFEPVTEERKNAHAGIGEFGKRYNIWRVITGGGNVTKDKCAYKHPAIFSETLASDLIKSWSNEGDLVLDPFAGSGTTLKMAKQLNRNYIGIEIAPEYIEIINKRLNI